MFIINPFLTRQLNFLNPYNIQYIMDKIQNISDALKIDDFIILADIPLVDLYLFLGLIELFGTRSNKLPISF